MAKPRIQWSPDMVQSLRTMRDRGEPVVVCAERIGVGYLQALRKARELGIADRRNFGRMPGRERVAVLRNQPVRQSYG
jgi:hypothetical protein